MFRLASDEPRSEPSLQGFVAEEQPPEELRRPVAMTEPVEVHGASARPLPSRTSHAMPNAAAAISGARERRRERAGIGASLARSSSSQGDDALGR
jgi:hypothetical protein